MQRVNEALLDKEFSAAGLSAQRGRPPVADVWFESIARCLTHLIAVDIEVILIILELADYDSVIPSSQSPKDRQIDVTIN